MIFAFDIERRWPFYILPWAMFFISLLVTFFVWRNAELEARDQLQNYFDFRVREATMLTEHRMLAQEQVLRGAQGLFAASRSVERDEFRDYVASLHLEENYPGIQGVGYAQILHPAGARKLHTSIVYLEPFAGRNLRALGYDMYSEPVRRAAMEQARDTGAATISGKVTLVQETEKNVQAGFLMYLPIYRNNAPHGTLEERRANILGWVYLPLRMGDLASGMYGEQASDLDIHVYDGGTTSQDALMYDSNTVNSPREGLLHSERQISLAGHEWTLSIYSQPGLRERIKIREPRNLAFLGIAAGLLLTWLAWLLVHGRELAVNAARKMNAELSESEDRYHFLFESNPMPMWVFDERSLKFLEVNETAIRHYGYSRAEFQDMTIRDIRPQEDIPNLLEVIANSRDGKVSGEWKHQKKDGSVIDVAINTVPMRYKGTAARIAIIRDVTERRRAERALVNESEKNLMLLRNASDGIHILDFDGKIIEVSDSFCSMLGYSRDEVLGMHVSQWDAGIPEPELSRVFRQQFENPQRSQFETRHRRKDGSVFDVEISGFPLQLGGKLVVFNSSRDITARKHAEQALRVSEERFRLMADSAPVLIWMAGTDKLSNWFNQGWLEFTGRSLAQEMGNGWAEGVHPDDFQRCLDTYIDHFDRRQPFRMEYRLKRHDGTYRWLVDSGRPLFDEKHEFTGYIGSCIDISERKEIEDALRASEARWKFALEGAGDGVWDLNVKTDEGTVSKRLEEILGWTEEQLGKDGRAWRQFIHPKDRDAVACRLAAYLREASANFTYEFRLQSRSGEYKWVLARGMVAERDNDGSPLRLIGTISDISERKQAEEMIKHMAQWDALTDVPNRALFSDRLQQALAVARRDQLRLALLFIDLDNFKPVNDTLGHQVGDLMLKEVARRLQDCVRASDTVARIGGDEFIVLLPAIDGERDALLVAEKIRRSLSSIFRLAGRELFISSSIGVALYPEHGTSENELVRSADAAMYFAKKRGRNTIKVYHVSLQEGAKESA